MTKLEQLEKLLNIQLIHGNFLSVSQKSIIASLIEKTIRDLEEESDAGPRRNRVSQPVSRRMTHSDIAQYYGAASASSSRDNTTVGRNVQPTPFDDSF